MSRPSLSSILVILIGGVILSAITVAGSTWILLLKVERVAINGTIRGTDTRIWRYLHNENPGVEWVLISDWGQDLVNGPGGFEDVPDWAAPRLAKSPTGKQRIGGAQGDPPSSSGAVRRADGPSRELFAVRRTDGPSHELLLSGARQKCEGRGIAPV